MSGSRFVLKQIHVRGAGSSDLTRYVAKGNLDPAREGKSARALFTADADDLTYWEARKWLSITGGALDKRDVLHYVLSFKNAREYEVLGETEEEREREIVAFMRQSIAAGLREGGIEEMRWVAGIHRNTDNPHVHILLNKNAVGSDTKDLIHVPRLSAPIIAHHAKTTDGRREFSYGSLISSFAAQVDMRCHVRTRFLQFENALRTVRFTRELLSPEIFDARTPTDAEQLVGRWIVAEINAAHPPVNLKINRAQETKISDELKPEIDEYHRLIDLRESVALLDRSALERGDEPPHAFIETEVLRDILTTPQRGLSITAHEQNPSLAQSRQRDSINRQPEHIESFQRLTRADARDQKLPELTEQTRFSTPPVHTH